MELASICQSVSAAHPLDLSWATWSYHQASLRRLATAAYARRKTTCLKRRSSARRTAIGAAAANANPHVYYKKCGAEIVKSGVWCERMGNITLARRRTEAVCLCLGGSAEAAVAFLRTNRYPVVICAARDMVDALAARIDVALYGTSRSLFDASDWASAGCGRRAWLRGGG